MIFWLEWYLEARRTCTWRSYGFVWICNATWLGNRPMNHFMMLSSQIRFSQLKHGKFSLLDILEIWNHDLQLSCLSLCLNQLVSWWKMGIKLVTRLGKYAENFTKCFISWQANESSTSWPHISLSMHFLRFHHLGQSWSMKQCL